MGCRHRLEEGDGEGGPVLRATGMRGQQAGSVLRQQSRLWDPGWVLWLSWELSEQWAAQREGQA